jgi:hypothetical protein
VNLGVNILNLFIIFEIFFVIRPMVVHPGSLNSPVQECAKLLKLLEGKMEHFRKIQWILVMMLFGAVFCSGAMAQDDDEVTVLNTMIVAGSGTKTELLDTNASIHVLTLKDIQNSCQKSTAELIGSIPGVVNQKSGSQTYFSIRGTRTGMSYRF